MPIAVLALAAGAFGIGTTEFIIAHGPGLTILPLVGAALTAVGLAVALVSQAPERRAATCAV